MSATLERSSKLITVSISSPSTFFYPGSTFQLTISNNSGLPLRDTFQTLRVELKGNSGVQTGGALPSLHPLVTETMSVNMSVIATNTTTLDIKIPAKIGCPCRPSASTALPPSSRIVNRDGNNREAQESGLVISYSLEIVGRRKGGLGKGEKMSIPIKVSPPQPLGPTTLTVPTLDAASASWAALGSWVWATSRLEAGGIPVQAGVHSAEIQYHLTSITDTEQARLRWRLALTPAAGRTAADLLPMLSEGGGFALDVFLARKVMPIAADGKNSEKMAGKAYKLEPDEEWGVGRKEPVVLAAGVGGAGSARVEGWIDMPVQTLGICRSCNGELQYFLISSLTSDAFKGAINLHKQVHREMPTPPLEPTQSMSPPRATPIALKPPPPSSDFASRLDRLDEGAEPAVIKISLDEAAVRPTSDKENSGDIIPRAEEAVKVVKKRRSLWGLKKAAT